MIPPMRSPLALLVLLAGCSGSPQAPRDLGRELGADLARDAARDLARAERGDLPPVVGRFALLKAGSFQMGSPETESCREPGETPRQVMLTRPFEIHESEVTEADFLERMGYRPEGSACGPACPVRNVSWHEAAAFANALSASTNRPLCYTCTGSLSQVSCAAGPGYSGTELGKTIYDCLGYRLPTEAEWEYAYRAGSTTALYGGSLAGSCSGVDPVADVIAWYKHSAGGEAHTVGGKQPNAWGLHDLAGNVSEWMHDGYLAYGIFATQDPLGPSDAQQKVVRGGSYESEVAALRAAARASDTPGSRWSERGFRLVRTRLW